MGGEFAQIFDIRLNSTSASKVLAFVRDSLARKAKFSLLTPNPEIVSAALTDRKLLAALNNASLRVPDGVGLSQAARFLSLWAPKNKFLRLLFCLIQGLGVGLATFFARDWLQESLPIIKGRLLFLELVKLANKKGLKIFLLGGQKDEARKAGEKIRRSFKRVRIAFASGPRLERDGRPVSAIDKDIEKYVVAQINEFNPDILFVGFGAPKQEKWLMKWLPALDVGGGMTVGGAFRYLAGDAKLPPKWMEELGFEWLWRALSEPWRIKRVATAFPIFPLKVFISKLSIRC
ncbi:MAG: WecB/TagA/CpsF family glycosyltransferase [Patescibacteria group bacterium]